MKTSLILSACAFGALALPLAAQAQSVSTNFQGDTQALAGTSYSNFMISTDTAGVNNAANWNNDTGGNSGTISVVKGSNTGASGIAGLTEKFNAYDAHDNNFAATYPAGAPNGNYKLMNGYIESGPTTAAASATVTVTGIPYSTYSLYVYAFNGTAETGTYTFQATTSAGVPTGTPVSKTALTLASFNGSFSDATLASGGNYILFTGLTSANFTLTAQSGSATVANLMPIDGIQIVAAAPEPAAFVPVVLGLGMVGLLAARRRRAGDTAR